MKTKLERAFAEITICETILALGQVRISGGFFQAAVAYSKEEVRSEAAVAAG